MGQKLPARVRPPAGPVLGASRLGVPPRQSSTDHPVIALRLAGCGHGLYGRHVRLIRSE
jgi:hypothetical protein